MAFSLLFRPSFKFGPIPLKTVILMPKLSWRHSVTDIVFDVRGCQDNGLGPDLAKNDFPKNREPPRVKMLDHLLANRGVETFQPIVGISQGALKKFQTLGAAFEGPKQPLFGFFQGAQGNVLANDPVESLFVGEPEKQTAFPAA